MFLGIASRPSSIHPICLFSLVSSSSFFCSLQWNCNTCSFWNGSAPILLCLTHCCTFLRPNPGLVSSGKLWRCYPCYSISSSPVSSLSQRRTFLCYVVEFRHHKIMWLWPRTCGWAWCMSLPSTSLKKQFVCLRCCSSFPAPGLQAEFQTAAAQSAFPIWLPHGTEPPGPIDGH